jgi:flagellar basal-body rod protein FlgG
MTIPQNVLSINVSQTRLVTAMVAGQTAPQQVGQITLANFANDAGLQPLGGNLYTQTEASGQLVTGLPGDPGFGSISQGYLESSNVDPVKEITDLISAQRAYEMNSKVIQAASEMSATLSKV